jgi:hypothetical protein
MYSLLFLKGMRSEKIVIYVSAPILELGLKLQFESWHFTHIEFVSSFAQTLESAYKQPTALLLLGTDIKDIKTGLNCFALAQMLQTATLSIPILFLDKTMREPPQPPWKRNSFMPYAHAWLNNPPHSKELWEGMNKLLTTRK